MRSASRPISAPLAAAAALLALALACYGGGERSSETAAAGPGPSTSAGPTPDAHSEGGVEVFSPSASILSEMGALYLTITNHEAEADRLLRVETAAAERAEIHVTTEEDGVVRMRHRPEGLEIAAGATVELAPGGSHIMLIDATLPAADPVPATLHFERAGPIEVLAPLASLDRMGGGAGDHEDHGGHEGH